VTSITELLGVERPILQAPIGGCAGPELIAAVSQAGGLGILPCTWSSPTVITAQVEAIRALGDRPFGANLVLAFDVDAQLAALLAARVPVITFSWGRAGRERVARCHAAGARVALQVGTATAVTNALDDGVDVLIAQGVEAGGHVQSTTPLIVLLSHALATAGMTPVVAAGGIATAADVRDVLDRGAAAAMLGTRFVASRESEAHPAYKRALVAATGDDSCYTLCFDGEWPFAPHRVLRNETLDAWEAAGCPQPGARPGEGDVVARGAGGSALTRYSDDPPRAGDRGSILASCLYAGTSVGGIDDIPSARELVSRLDPR
jgi:NAD(P)H-dependent flavin oxidoreductase YrpB (nitropropane dioxygenase family)